MSLGFRALWPVDPGGFGEPWWLWWVVEPVGVQCVGGVQDDSACSPDSLGLAGVHDVRGQKSKSGVAMMIVVRVEKRGTERAGVPDAGERLGERRAVLHGLEKGLAVRVVVTDVGTGVGLDDAEVCQEQRDGLGPSRCSWQTSASSSPTPVPTSVTTTLTARPFSRP